MAAQLEPMQINDGDPITSEVMRSIIANINTINKLSNATFETGGSENAPVTKSIKSSRLKVPVNTAGTGKATVTFDAPFNAQPNITCTIWQASTANFLKHKYLPVVTSLTASGFTISMLPIGATSNGEVYVQWIAVG
jgi:hypothetical protein